MADAVAEQDRIQRLRWQAGWSIQEGAWFSPEGISAADWERECGYPLPEDPAFLEWAGAFYHYEALDNDLDPDALWPTAPSNPLPSTWPK